MTWTIVSIVTFYLGGLNTILARVAGTCTQGDADRLWGAVLSIILYLIAIIALARCKYLWATTIICIPAFVVILWQAAFALKLSFQIAINHVSACEALEGIPYPDSGSEIAFAILWPILGIGTIIALSAVYIGRYINIKSG